MLTPALVDKIHATVSPLWAAPVGPQSLLDFSRSIVITEGPDKGRKYDPEGHAPQWFLLQALSDIFQGKKPWGHLVVVKPTQDGGTWTTVTMPCLYCTTELRDPFIAGFPDLRLANYVWRQKVHLAITKSGRAEWLPTSGPGSDGSSAPTEVALAGTPCYWIGAGTSNEAGQAGITARVLTRDELDSIPPHQAELMRGRLDAFGIRGITIDTSTIKLDTLSPILTALAQSTDGRIQYACVHCGHFQAWEWESVIYDASSVARAAATVRIVCKHCKAELADNDFAACKVLDRARLVMRGQTCDPATGRVAGEVPDSLAWGILWTALDSPRVTLAALVVKWVEAQARKAEGDHSLLRRFYRDRLCRPYLGDQTESASVSISGLAARSAASEYKRGHVPAGGLFVTTTLDVQKREIWWEAMAHGSAGRWWITDWGRELVVEDFRGEPTPAHVSAALDRIAARVSPGWATPDGQAMPPRLFGVDLGYQPDAVRDWLKAHPRWLGVRGAGDGLLSERPLGTRTFLAEGWLDVRRSSMGDLVHYAEADTIKHVIQAALARGQGEPGAGHIPAGQAADDWLIRQLCAEQFKDGKWVKIKKDNHLLDLAVYNLALARLSLDTGAGAPPPQVDPMAGLAEALQDFSRNRSRARGRVFG